VLSWSRSTLLTHGGARRHPDIPVPPHLYEVRAAPPHIPIAQKYVDVNTYRYVEM
jgi:hypothetical protein